MEHFSFNRKITFPEIISEPLVDKVLSLVKDDTINFTIEYVQSVDALKEYYEYLEGSVTKNLPFQILRGQPIAGYNHKVFPLTITTSKLGGSTQYINEELFYNPRGLPAAEARDSYVFGYTENRILTSITPKELIESFLDKKIPLFETNKGIYSANIYTPPKVRSISLEDIDFTNMNDQRTF